MKSYIRNINIRTTAYMRKAGAHTSTMPEAPIGLQVHLMMYAHLLSSYLSSVRHQLKFNQTIVCNCYCTLLLFGVLLPFIFLLSFIFFPPFMLPPRPPPLKPPGLLPKPPALDAPMVPADCVQFVNEEPSQ